MDMQYYSLLQRNPLLWNTRIMLANIFFYTHTHTHIYIYIYKYKIINTKQNDFVDLNAN